MNESLEKGSLLPVSPLEVAQGVGGAALIPLTETEGTRVGWPNGGASPRPVLTSLEQVTETVPTVVN